MATLSSYELKGKKLSFANWISNLSPTDTPFVSMTGKEAVNQTKFYWQTDRLAKPLAHAVIEGSDAVEGVFTATTVKENVTQILRKVVKVSDTVNSLANYGRGRELAYQMEKAGKAIKRDLEAILLSPQAKVDGSANAARKTAGFQALVAAKDATDVDTGAKVQFETAATTGATEADIFNMTYNLYLAGSKADTIMFHPKHAAAFAALLESVEAPDDRIHMFEGSDTKLVHYVNSLVDPLGQEFKLIPNRFMPDNALYFFTPSDWTQMVLRAPTRLELAKEGSAETWMMEMEVGLRHRDPFASGVLLIKKVVTPAPTITTQPQAVTVTIGEQVSLTAVATGAVSWAWFKNGTAVAGATGAGNNATFTKAVSVKGDAGTYSVKFTNATGTTTSSNAIVTVNDVVVP